MIKNKAELDGVRIMINIILNQIEIHLEHDSSYEDKKAQLQGYVDLICN